MKRIAPQEDGFTLIELIVTIVIIGILSTLVIYTPTSFLVSSRDQERADDVASIARRLEQAYLDQDISAGSSFYPSTTRFASDIAAKSGSVARLQVEALRAPGSSSSSVSMATSTSTSTPGGTGEPTISQYVYQPLKADGSLCTVSTDACTRFYLYYRKEVDSTLQTLMSVHQQ